VPVSLEPNTGSNDSQEIIIKLEQLTEKEKAGNNHKDKKSIITNEEFVVQVGAFSDATKAKNQPRSLESNGIKKAYTEMIKNENIKVTRVRVGPFSTREAAEKEQKKLKELGVNGVVINR
jgi:DedD protein